MPQAKAQAKAQPKTEETKAQEPAKAQEQPKAQEPVKPQEPAKTQEPTQTVDSNDKKQVPALFVKSHLRQGHRRAGYRWTRDGFGIELALLSKSQIEHLKNDPNLSVEEVEIDAPEAGE